MILKILDTKGYTMRDRPGNSVRLLRVAGFCMKSVRPALACYAAPACYRSPPDAICRHSGKRSLCAADLCCGCILALICSFIVNN